MAFTLVELLVVLTIAGIVLAVGMPQVRALIDGHQIRSTASDLFAAINLTRSQALTRGQRVMLTPAPPGNTDWRAGWVVFVDRNGNARLDGADELIFQQGPVATGISIRSAFSSGQATPYLAYNGSGRTCSASNSLAAHWGTVSLDVGAQRRNIVVSMLGRARICDPQLTPATCSGVDGDDE